MRKSIFIIIAIAFALSIAAHANAALLVNGSFDEIEYRKGLVGPDLDKLTGKQWGVYKTIPGWKTTKGAGIEVQRNTIVDAQSGDYYVELDSHGKRHTNTTMVQDVYLTKGSYKLSLYYQPRTDLNKKDNGIKVDLAGTRLKLMGKKSTWDPSGWQLFEQVYTIQSDDTYKLKIRAFGKENTLGGFIDSVKLAPIPEPATLIIFGSGLMGLFLKRKK